MKRIPAIASTVALFLASPLAAQVLWLEPSATDLLSTRVVAPPAGGALATEAREAVSFSWALPADRPLAAAPVPFTAESREYWLRVSGADLGRGVRLPTTAPGALIRLSPQPGAGGTAPRLEDIELRDAGGRSFPAGRGVAALASAEALAAAGADFEPGTAAFLVREELGAGALTLGWAAAEPRATYIVHVFDRASKAVLRLSTNRPFYLDGDRLVLEAGISLAGARLALEQVTGFAVSPAGRAWPLRFARQPRGTYRAELRLDAREAAQPGLWQVEIQAGGRRDGFEVLRNARTAFPCAVPTARFSGDVELGKASGLSLTLGVEAATPGRYEVRGILFGTNPATGGLEPFAAAHSAAWLETGRGVLALEVEPSILAGSHLKPPYEVRQLELRDQGRMGLLEGRGRALVIRP